MSDSPPIPPPDPRSARKRSTLPKVLIAAWVLYILLALFLDRVESTYSESMEGSPALARTLMSILFHLLLAGSVYLGWSRWRKRWKDLLLFLLSCGFALLLGQAIISFVYPELNLPNLAAIRETKYHHLTPPNGRFLQGAAQEKPLIIETNEDGFRTKHTRRDFQKHDVRIAILGDSFPFGLGVESEDSLPDRLEHLLRTELGLDAAVLNCGVISYSPFLEALIYEDLVVHYRPTHTLLFLDATDIGDDQRYLSQAKFEKGRPVFEYQGVKEFEYWGFVHESFLRPVIVNPLMRPWRGLWSDSEVESGSDSPGLYRTQATIDGEPVTNRFFIYRHPLEKTRPYFEKTFANIEKIAGMAEEIGSEFALVVFPRFHHWNPEECPNNWEVHEYGVDEPHQFEFFRFFEEKAADAPFPTVNLLPAFQATDRFPLVFKNDPHWNAEGHRFVSEQTLAFLQSQYFSEAAP